MKRILKKITALLLIFTLLPVLVSCKATPLVVKDGAGNIIATLYSESDVEDGLSAPYIRIAISEAIDIFKVTLDISQKKAVKKLFSQGYEITTFYDSSVVQAMADANTEDYSLGASVVGKDGKLLGVYSKDNVNYATMTVPPYSSFKPLSVYAPALEHGLINWSYLVDDSPVKEVNGTDWPSNPNGKYKNAPVTVAEGVKDSLNTIAVKVYQKLGRENSLEFLSRFGITLDYEREMDEEESIGNIALGYLNQGVSTVDMAGYYSTFSNNGIYIKPTAIEKICDKNGQIIYKSFRQSKKITDGETASVMNMLLQNVVLNGTGVKAKVKGVETAGKTGTGEVGNWFCGLTPDYSIAVFYGKDSEFNESPSIFCKIASALNHNKKTFSLMKIDKSVYCTQSGLEAADKCPQKSFGYYADVLKKCDKH